MRGLGEEYNMKCDDCGKVTDRLEIAYMSLSGGAGKHIHICSDCMQQIVQDSVKQNKEGIIQDEM